MKTSISDYDDYKKICKLAAQDDEVFNTFRKNSTYAAILEHVSLELGERYCQWIHVAPNFSEDRLNKSRFNDVQGGASIVDYFTPFTNVCPSTMRYLKVALELEQLFGSLDNYNIIEIGSGYGGQCKLINSLWNIHSYTLVDLPESLDLAKKYLSNTDKCVFKDANELSNTDKYDLVISNYAFSECEKSVQMHYIDTVLSRASKGYMTYNNICHLFNVESLSRNECQEILQCNKMPENPVSGDNEILYWSK